MGHSIRFLSLAMLVCAASLLLVGAMANTGLTSSSSSSSFFPTSCFRIVSSDFGSCLATEPTVGLTNDCDNATNNVFWFNDGELIDYHTNCLSFSMSNLFRDSFFCNVTEVTQPDIIQWALEAVTGTSSSSEVRIKNVKSGLYLTAVSETSLGLGLRNERASQVWTLESAQCGQRCGDGICNDQIGENCTTCARDCGVCPIGQGAHIDSQFPLLIHCPECRQVFPRNIGCSGPDFPYEDELTPACNAHDICYRCLTVLDPRYRNRDDAQKVCDEQFRQNMRAICNRLDFFDRALCRASAEAAYAAVRAFGESSVRGESYCNASWYPFTMRPFDFGSTPSLGLRG